MYQYQVKLCTGEKTTTAKNAKAYVTIYGERGDTGKRYLKMIPDPESPPDAKSEENNDKTPEGEESKTSDDKEKDPKDEKKTDENEDDAETGADEKDGATEKKTDDKKEKPSNKVVKSLIRCTSPILSCILCVKHLLDLLFENCH